MSRGLRVIVGVITLLCASAVAILVASSRGPDKTPRQGPRALEETPTFARPADPPSPVPDRAAPAPALAAVATPQQAAPVATYPTDPAQLLRALGPLQREVAEQLAVLDERSRCDLHGVTVLLTLSTGDGDVLVEDASVQARPAEPEPGAQDHDPARAEGVADEAVAGCVLREINGKTLRVPDARAGRRWQMKYWSVRRQG